MLHKTSKSSEPTPYNATFSFLITRYCHMPKIVEIVRADFCPHIVVCNVSHSSVRSSIACRSTHCHAVQPDQVWHAAAHTVTLSSPIKWHAAAHTVTLSSLIKYGMPQHTLSRCPARSSGMLQHTLSRCPA